MEGAKSSLGPRIRARWAACAAMLSGRWTPCRRWAGAVQVSGVVGRTARPEVGDTPGGDSGDGEAGEAVTDGGELVGAAGEDGAQGRDSAAEVAWRGELDGGVVHDELEERGGNARTTARQRIRAKRRHADHSPGAARWDSARRTSGGLTGQGEESLGGCSERSRSLARRWRSASGLEVWVSWP